MESLNGKLFDALTVKWESRRKEGEGVVAIHVALLSGSLTTVVCLLREPQINRLSTQNFRKF